MRMHHILMVSPLLLSAISILPAKAAEPDRASADNQASKADLISKVRQLEAENARLHTLASELSRKLEQSQQEKELMQCQLGQASRMKLEMHFQLATLLMKLGERSLPSFHGGESTFPIFGLVNKVSKTGNLIEVTIGSDDGLRKDTTLDVHNAKRYLGRAIIIETKPDTAVARMETLNGKIQRGDRVSTLLKVESKEVTEATKK